MHSLFYRLFSGSALRIATLIVTAATSFFMMPFLISSLGDRMYGFWTLVGTFLSYYSLLDLGLSSAVNRHIAGALGAQNADEANNIINTAFVLFSGLGILVFSITILLAGFASAFCTDQNDASLFSKVILVLGLGIAISFPFKVFTGILTSQLRFDIICFLQLLSLTIRTFSFVLILTSGYSVLTLAYASLLSSIPEMLLLFFLAKRHLSCIKFSRRYLQITTAKTLFSYSSIAIIAQLADILRFNVDSIVITSFIGLAAVTHFSIASELVRYSISFMIATMGVFQPLFARQHGSRDEEAMRSHFMLATRLSIHISSFIAFGLIAWGDPFIERWMGSTFSDVYPCLMILTIGAVFALWQIPSVNLLYATSNHKFYAVANTFEGALNLFFSILLVRSFGIIGVAIGTFVPMFLVKVILQPIYVCRVSNITYFVYVSFIFRELITVLISLVLPSIIAFYGNVPHYLYLFLSGLAASLCYAFSIWFIGFSKSERIAFYRCFAHREPLGSATV